MSKKINKQKKHFFILKVALIAIVLGIGSGFDISHYYSTHSKSAQVKLNVVTDKTESNIPTSSVNTTPENSTTNNDVAPPPAAVPKPVPQTVSNNQQYALYCSQAQSGYDQLFTSTNNQLNSFVSNTQLSGEVAGETQTQINDSINQFYKTYNTEVAGQYAGYLEQVRAVPGCVADFQPPSPFSMLSPS